MTIRTATLEDLEAIVKMEYECFPETDAVPASVLEDWIRIFPGHFWLMLDGDRIVSFVDGFTTDEPDILDEMYERAELHNEDGRWQMLFGVVTVPEYRGRGCAGELIRHAIDDARRSGRAGLVLACKDRYIGYYEEFGFVNEGISDKSFHGGSRWNQMRLSL